MSKKLYNKPNETSVEQVAPSPEPKREVAKHLQCPCCYPTRGGTGTQKWWRRVSGTLVKRCYTCNECGYHWTADVRTHTEVLKIEHQTIDVQIRPVNLEER